MHTGAVRWTSACLVCLSSAWCSALVARECTCFRGHILAGVVVLVCGVLFFSYVVLPCAMGVLM